MLNHVFWDLWRLEAWEQLSSKNAFLRIKRTIGIFSGECPLHIVSIPLPPELLRRIYDKALIQLLQHLTLTFYQKQQIEMLEYEIL